MKHFGHKKLYINGELIESADGTIYDIVCPGNESVVATIAWAGTKETELVLNAAKNGFESWSQLTEVVRLDWIDKLRNKILEHRDHLRESIMFEMGKIWEGTDEDLTSLTDSLAYYSDEIKSRTNLNIADKDGTHKHQLISQPLGVVVAFLAYNFPLLNLGFKLGPALAAGCSIIIKPSEYSPLSAYIIGELCHKINFPAGVINIICGDTREVGIPLSESKIPKMITMIGSTETAQKLIRQSSKTSIKRYSMECGGNAPFIVFEDADLEASINLGAALKIGNSGQICVAPNRFFIQSSCIEKFIEGMTKKFKSSKIGFGRENNPDLGPLANKQSITKLTHIVREAKAQGGQVICGGSALDGPGYFFEATIIKFNNNNAPILQEEVFGPIAFVAPFTTKEEVIILANNTQAGLASYVFSSNQETLSYFTEKLEFGEIQLNGVKYDIYLPHGGIKNSGIGVDCSPFALDDYLIRKRVSQALSI